MHARDAAVPDSGTLPPLGYIWSRVQKHEADLYVGNGKPALTLRMATAENCIEDQEKRLSTVERNMARSLWLLLTILVTLLADIAKSAVFHAH